jgi:thiol-disulfide isomerase/thioredoxin
MTLRPFVLCLLASLPLTAQLRAAPEPGDETMRQCADRLSTIHKALAAYEKDHGRLPDQLSDLHPKCIPDKHLFHCPADPSPQGTPGRDFAHRDPRVPMSYTYEFSADESHGLPTPLGKNPTPDVGNAWGTCRLVMTWQASFYGDQVPVVRCFHHKEEMSDDPRVINLTRTGRLYYSTGVWEDHPDSVAQVLERATSALATPDAQAFRQNWYLGRLNEYLSDKPYNPAYSAHRPAFAAFAEKLAAAAPKLGENNAPNRLALRLAADCYGGAAETDKAVALMDRMMDLSLKAGEYQPGKDRWGSVPSERDLYTLARIYRAGNRRGHEAALLVALNAARPRVGTYLDNLAEVNEAAGAKEVAGKWRDELDPGRMLVSRPAPLFDLPAAAGGKVSLNDLLASKKAVLINFWFYGCGPCRAETPHLQKLYTQLKDKGFEIVAINLGDPPDAVQKYIKDFNVTFPVALGGSPRNGERSVFSDYGVSAYPTNFLIDHDGKVVWHNRGYEESAIEELRKELEKVGVK